MDEPKSLDSLFKEKIFRIPDYQRGYAWQREQLKAFWEDLVNLSDRRSHYAGVLTLKQIPASDFTESANEYWLVDDHSYKIYHIVDGCTPAIPVRSVRRARVGKKGISYQF